MAPVYSVSPWTSSWKTPGLRSFIRFRRKMSWAVCRTITWPQGWAVDMSSASSAVTPTLRTIGARTILAGDTPRAWRALISPSSERRPSPRSVASRKAIGKAWVRN